MADPKYIIPQTYQILNDRIKAYTDESSFFESYQVVGVEGHARAAELEIGAAIRRLQKPENNPNKTDLFALTFYADRISALEAIQQPPQCMLMTFISRIGFGGKPVAIEMAQNIHLMVHCGNHDRPFAFAFRMPDKQDIITVTLDPAKRKPNHRCWSLQVEVDGTYTSTSLTENDTLAVHFVNTPSLTDLIKDDGELVSIGHFIYNDNLRKLLDYQLLLASVLQGRDHTAVYELSMFVLKVCEGIPQALDYYARASALATMQVVGESNRLAPIVPKLDLSIAQQVLDSRLQAAVVFENAFRDLQGQSDSSANVRLFASVALDSSVDSEQAYIFLTDVAKKRFESAHEALKLSQDQFQSLQLTLADKQQAFKDGIEEWKTKNTLKAVGEALIAVAVIAGSIAVACVAPPAGAAGIAAGAAGIGSAVAGGASAVEKLSRIARVIEVIKKIYDKIKPGLEKVDQLVKALQTVILLTTRMERVDKATEGTLKSLSMPSSKGDDAIDLNADWDSFQAEMNILYDSIKDEKIPGAGDFFLTITQMVIRGKAILTAQTAVTSTGDAYLTVLTQSVTQKQHTERLRSAIPKIKGNSNALRLIKLTMAERLLALRTWITLDFEQYLAAYAWHALDPTRPVLTDPMKDIGAFRADAAAIQAKYAEKTSTLNIQSRKFCFSTTGAGTIASASQPALLSVSPDFMDRLKRDRTAEFVIDILHPVFARFGRIRTTSFKIILKGPASNTSQILSLRVVLGSQMGDLLAVKNSDTASRVVDYVTTESVYGFEFAPTTGAVLMEGALSGEHKPSPLSPFRTWRVHVVEGDGLVGMEELSVELMCEVSYVS
ncbi:hypothetical protein M011DRAFT_526940 [Sporormia fimetaria CBS 119925]|uniref:Uncharacterized protein n=1 Tax=Sporormia fimetaria CBS 119925 TaxID=1340428 RepID=A0A6A6V7L4_9PLEO|nr:hypothetical protein M011DRAFT_526940 [Sporormia fimetaria CBS 119925]